jgi:hypothetical protein
MNIKCKIQGIERGNSLYCLFSLHLAQISTKQKARIWEEKTRNKPDLNVVEDLVMEVVNVL